MGNKCCSCSNEVYNLLATDEKEIDFCSYKSSSDSILKEVDKDYNYFTKVPLIDFINLLENYTIETSTIPFDGPLRSEYSYKDQFLISYMEGIDFMCLIENKILLHKNVLDITKKDCDKEQIFKQYCEEVYKSLESKLTQHINNGSNNKNKFKICKKHILSFGFLFCLSTNIGKIKLLFDLYKNDEEKFVKSNELNEALLSMFLLASYCAVSARNKVGKSHDSIKKLSQEDIKKLIDSAELKDSENLVDFFNESFFCMSPEGFEWEDFKKMFGDKDTNMNFAWIFSTNGIRQKLEEKNI